MSRIYNPLKMKPKSFLSILLILTLSLSTAFSQTVKEERITAVLKQLGIDPKDCQMALAAEKVLPYAESQSVLALPVIVEEGEGYAVFDSYILVIDSETGNILHKFHEKRAWFSDAERFESIQIDTAPYILAPGKRAFGIRTHFYGSSRPNPFSNEYISLFLPAGDGLDRVLDNFLVASSHGEWDTHCEGEFQSEKKTILISEKQTTNFYDLIIKSKIISRAQRKKGDECVGSEKVTAHSETKRFVNGKYMATPE
jgi:hypothetical protein